MKIISRLIILEFLKSTIMVALFVLFMQMLVMFLGELKYIGENNYTFYNAIFYVLSQSVVVVYNMLPTVCFIGALIALGKLSNSSELIVIQASGYSIARLLIVLAASSFFLTLSIFAVTQKWGYAWANNGQIKQLRWHGKKVDLSDSAWLHQQGRYINIKNVVSASLLRDVSIYDIGDDNSLTKIIYARSVERTDNHWVGKNISIHSLLNNKSMNDKKNSMILPMHFDYNYFLHKRSDLSPYYNLYEIHKLIYYQKDVGSDIDGYRYLFWSEIMLPIIIVIMTLLSIPFVVRSLRSVSVSSQVFKGVMIGFSLYVLEVLIGRFSLYFRFNPILSAVMPTLVFSLLFLCMMRKRI